MSDGNKFSFDLPVWVRSICTLTIVGVIAYKIYQTPIALTVDFPTLLSLLLALFSVGLAAMFYFKATETSNTFYDNTYKFTRDIAQLLSKMESGFGERLRHLDEGYTSMREHIQKGAMGGKASGVEDTKKKIEEERADIRKSLAERNQIIAELLEKSQLQSEEKAEITQKLQEKEQEVEEAQNELMKMNRRLAVERMRRQKAGPRRRHHFDEFTRDAVLRALGPEALLERSPRSIIREFSQLAEDLPPAYLDDLASEGYFEGELTVQGARYLQRLAESDA